MRESEERRIRIAMLGSFPPQTQGVPEYCRALTEALVQRVPVHAIGFRRMYPSWLFPGVARSFDPSKAPMAAPGLAVEHRLTWYNPLTWIRAALATPADVFHVQWWSLPLWPIALLMALLMRLRGKVVVVTVHNVLPHEGGALFVAAGRLLCGLARRVIVHSEANRRKLLAHYKLPPAKAVVVPMGILPAPDVCLGRAEARRALGLAAPFRYMLSFGIIRPYKGVDTLLRAFALLAGRHSDLHLIIAGKPWCDWTPYQDLIDTSGLAGRVHLFLDYIPEGEIPRFFGAADIVVLPYSHFDAQSAVCATALPYRKPILVTEVGGLTDWVDHDPAWFVPPSEPEALAARLDAFWADPEAAARAFEVVADRVLKRFSWDSIAEEYLRVYREVLGPL